VFKTTNSGASWSPRSVGLTHLSVFALAIDPLTPSTVYAGTFGDGVLRSLNSGTSWSAVIAGFPEPPDPQSDLARSVSALAINPGNHNMLFAGTDAGVFKSFDRGAHWQPASQGLTSSSVYALAIDPVTVSTVYAGTGTGVFRSTNFGGEWSPTGLTGHAAVALAIDPQTPSTLYAGTAGEGVFKSTNGGDKWFAVNKGLTDPSISALVVNPSQPAILYAGTVGSGVLKSETGGNLWSPVNSGLTALDVLALAIDPGTPTTLFAGTGSGGVFRSTDSGASWGAMNLGLTTLDVRSLAVDSSLPPTLYAGVAEGGVFGITLAGVGTFELTPSPAEVVVKERLTYELTWTVPSGSWQSLDTLILRVRDGAETILQVLWDQQADVFRLYDVSAAKYGPPFAPGSPSKLESNTATLYLADSAVQGAGPDLPAVTLTLSVEFKKQAAGRIYQVEVAASNDLGDATDFIPAGVLTVNP